MVSRKKKQRLQEQGRRRSSRAPSPDGLPDQGRASTRRALVRFAGLFVGSAIVLYGLVSFGDVLDPYLSWTARRTGDLLALLGETVVVRESSVITSRFHYEIRQGCDGLEPAILFLSALLATPCSLRRKLWGALLGPLALLALNFVRLLSLYYVGVHWPSAFRVVHVDLWQPAYVLSTLAFFLAWSWWATQPAAGGVEAGAPSG